MVLVLIRALGPVDYLMLCAVEMTEVFIAVRRWKRLPASDRVSPGGRVAFNTVE